MCVRCTLCLCMRKPVQWESSLKQYISSSLGRSIWEFSGTFGRSVPRPVSRRSGFPLTSATLLPQEGRRREASTKKTLAKYARFLDGALRRDPLSRAGQTAGYTWADARGAGSQLLETLWSTSAEWASRGRAGVRQFPGCTLSHPPRSCYSSYLLRA